MNVAMLYKDLDRFMAGPPGPALPPEDFPLLTASGAGRKPSLTLPRRPRSVKRVSKISFRATYVHHTTLKRCHFIRKVNIPNMQPGNPLKVSEVAPELYFFDI